MPEPPIVHLPGTRVVVVSPHLDDGVFSLGASVAAWTRAGAAVDVLTVLACDPSSGAPAGGWDRRGGSSTEGESARRRREEDRRACALVGARPVWLPYGSVDYERHGDADEISSAVESALAEVDVALVPGFPLTHPDHEWLLRLLADARLPCRRVGLYAEQPYAARAGAEPALPEWVASALGEAPAFVRLRPSARDRVAKWRAIRAYRSQLPLLGMSRSVRRGAQAAALAPEWVAWTAHLTSRAR